MHSYFGLMRTGILLFIEAAHIKSPYYLCNKLWYKLDSNVQMATNVVEFKKMLNKMDLNDL